MKRKSIVLFLTLLTTVCVTGCGDQKGTVGDSLINADPTAYNQEAVNLSNETNTDITNLSEESVNEESISDENIEEDKSEETGDAEETPDESAESVEENPEETSEENSESEGDNEEATEENPEDENVEVKTEEKTEEKNVSSGVFEIENNVVTFSNVCGQDLEKLYLTFSVGYINNMEVLGTEKLLNGYCFNYSLTDVSTLKEAGIVSVSVTAETKKGEKLDFGSLEIIDLSNLSLVLSRNSEGYLMYLE